MVKFEVYDEFTHKREEVKGDVVYFRTIFKTTYGVGSPMFAVCDRRGNILSDGFVARITDDGKLKLSEGCKIPGIQTDRKGRILVEEF